MGNESTRPKKERFLQAVALTGNITTAAQAAGCNRAAHYKWLEKDEYYPARFEAAMEQASDLLEQEARRRAVAGVDKPVYQNGGVVGTVRQYSDVLLIFLMKGAMPEKYRERIDQRVEARFDVSQNIQIQEDTDWYGNADRFAALGHGPPTPGTVVTSEVQGSTVRKTLGKNGNGATGNGEGPRSK